MTKEEFIGEKVKEFYSEYEPWLVDILKECIEFGEKLERENKELEEDLEKFPVASDYTTPGGADYNIWGNPGTKFPVDPDCRGTPYNIQEMFNELKEKFIDTTNLLLKRGDLLEARVRLLETNKGIWRALELNAKE